MQLNNRKLSATVVAVLAAMAAAVGITSSSASPPAAPRVFPPDSVPYGMTYGEWSAAWWQWALSIPTDINPIADETGENAQQGQSGPVFFLAGNFGGTTVRDVTVPQGKALYFPIINIVAWSPGDFETEEEGSELVDFFMDFAGQLSCEIDGIAVQNLGQYRFQSPLFAFTVPDDNVFGLDATITYDGISDGYWIMLPPLSVGEHTIHFHGENHNPFFDFVLDVTYNLTVAP